MTRTEELIIRSQRGEVQAKELLLTENAGLIWSVAHRFMGRGVELDDLYQLGCLGFIKAIDGFDPQYGTQFSTYAVPKITGEIRRYMRDDGAVKVSRTLKEHAAQIHAKRCQLTNLLGREPTIQELSAHTGIAMEDIAMAESALVCVESIHQPFGDEGFTLESVLADYDSEERMIEQLALYDAVSRLPLRERQVICLRYFHGLTQERIARIICVSQVQVSRIEKKAIEKLRELIA